MIKYLNNACHGITSKTLIVSDFYKHHKQFNFYLEDENDFSRWFEKTARVTNQLEKEDVFLKTKISVLEKIKTEIKGIIHVYTDLDNLSKEGSPDLDTYLDSPPADNKLNNHITPAIERVY